MKQLLSFALILFCVGAFAASPSYSNFSSNQFAPSATYTMTIKNGALMTNPIVNSGTIIGNASGLTNVNSLALDKVPIQAIIACGDSIAIGNGPESPTNGWFNALTNIYPYNLLWSTNISAGGARIQDQTNWFNNALHPFRPSVTGRPTLVLVNVGVNDFGGATTEAVFTNAYYYFVNNQLKADGFQVGIVTPFLIGTLTDSQYTNGVRAAAFLLSMTNIDYRICSQWFPGPGNPGPHSTWWDADNVHLSILGANMFSSFVDNCLRQGYNGNMAYQVPVWNYKGTSVYATDPNTGSILMKLVAGSLTEQALHAFDTIGSSGFVVSDSQNGSTGGAAQVTAKNSTGATAVSLVSHGSAFGGNLFGIARASMPSVFSQGGTLTIGTESAHDMVFGANDVEYMRVGNASGVIIKSNVYPTFTANYANLGSCGCVFWNSNGTLYLVCTNSIASVVVTNKLGGL